MYLSNLKNRERTSKMETYDKAVVVSALDRESEALETELANLANLLDSLAKRLAPALLTSPQDDEKPATSQAMSPLCSRISGWQDRAKNACKCVNKLLEELEL